MNESRNPGDDLDKPKDFTLSLMTIGLILTYMEPKVGKKKLKEPLFIFMYLIFKNCSVVFPRIGHDTNLCQ